MNRAIVGLSLVSWMVTSSAFAGGQDTAELLSARALQILSLRIRGKELLYKTKDDTSNGLTFRSPQTFVATDEVIVGFENFNPFLQQVAVDTSTGPDPSVADLQKFADALATFPKFAPLQLGLGGPPPADCAAYEHFHGAVQQLSTLLSAEPQIIQSAGELPKPVTIALLRDTAGAAIGKDGVKTAARVFDLAAAAFEDKLQKAQTQVRTVANFSKNAGSCPDIRVSTLALLFEVTFDGQTRVSRIEKSAKDIRKVATTLSALESSPKWMNQGQFEVARLEPASGLVSTSDIGVTQLEFISDATGAVGTRPLAGSEPIKAKLRLRKYRFLIPEFSAGGVWADIDVRRYGTTTKDGKVVVSEPKMEKQDFSAAAILNLVMRTWRGEVVHPMLQLGVSTGKDSPSVLVGGGFRLTGTKHFGLSFGALFARVKELQNLKPGDTIGGTADIEKDLKPETQISPYICLQLSL